MTTDVATCDEDSPFSEVVGLVEQASGSRVVILRNGAPAGFLTLKSLAAMSKPVEFNSFGAAVPCSSTTDHLRVEDPCSIDAV